MHKVLARWFWFYLQDDYSQWDLTGTQVFVTSESLSDCTRSQHTRNPALIVLKNLDFKLYSSWQPGLQVKHKAGLFYFIFLFLNSANKLKCHLCQTRFLVTWR